MLKELIHTKMQEIFAEYQEANGITSGDIAPWDSLQLERVEGIIKDMVERICSYQSKANHYVYEDVDGEAHTVNCADYNEDQFFTEVSRRICFDDCTNENVTAIFWQGKEIRYAGWQPCMKYEYKDLDGNTVWVAYFEEWDH